MGILVSWIASLLIGRLSDRFKPYATWIAEAAVILALILSVALAGYVWLKVHDRNLLKSYVAQEQYAALVAQKAKAEHDRQIAQDALNAYRKAAEADQIAREQQDAIDQQAADEHARKCKVAGNCYPLTAEDWD